MKDLVAYLREVSLASSSLLREKFAHILAIISDEKLKASLESYLDELPVISFNGARYDLNVMRKYLIPELVKTGSIQYVVKKGCSYMTIKTPELKFLDITYYIAPGFNYDSFLKAYKQINKNHIFRMSFWTAMKNYTAHSSLHTVHSFQVFKIRTVWNHQLDISYRKKRKKLSVEYHLFKNH